MSRPATARVFVDEQPWDAPVGATLRETIASRDPALARLLERGDAHVTDGVGRPIDLQTIVEPGSIFRVIRSPRR